MARNVNDGFEGLPDLDNNIVHIDSKHPIERGGSEHGGNSSFGFSIIGTGLGIIFLVLLFVAFYRISAGAEPLTFTSLIAGFQSMPNVIFTGFSDLTIGGDWGIFDFFRSFLNIFTGAFSVLLYVATLIIQLIIVLSWFVRWMFFL